jgi:hypothetical protein
VSVTGACGWQFGGGRECGLSVGRAGFSVWGGGSGGRYSAGAVWAVGCVSLCCVVRGEAREGSSPGILGGTGVDPVGPSFVYVNRTR